MHDLQTIIRLNNQPVNLRTPPAALREQRIRVEVQREFDVPAVDRVVYGAASEFEI